MATRKILLIVAIVLFLIGAAGVPLFNTVALGLACLAGAQLYGR